MNKSPRKIHRNITVKSFIMAKSNKIKPKCPMIGE